ncbi:MAG: hypothetical protein ABI399_00260 [Bauldia sp.]
MSDARPSRAAGVTAFILAAIAGFLVWWFSEALTGRREPWDGDVLWYFVVLFVVGFAATLFLRSPPFAAYWGAWVGQIVFGIVPFVACLAAGAMCTDQANLFPLGVVVLLAYTLPALIGAFLGRTAQRLLISL